MDNTGCNNDTALIWANRGQEWRIGSFYWSDQHQVLSLQQVANGLSYDSDEWKKCKFFQTTEHGNRVPHNRTDWPVPGRIYQVTFTTDIKKRGKMHLVMYYYYFYPYEFIQYRK